MKSLVTYYIPVTITTDLNFQHKSKQSAHSAQTKQGQNVVGMITKARLSSFEKIHRNAALLLVNDKHKHLIYHVQLVGHFCVVKHEHEEAMMMEWWKTLEKPLGFCRNFAPSTLSQRRLVFITQIISLP